MQTDLDLLFLTDPRAHPPAAFRDLVIELQRRRSVFHSEEAVKAAKPPKDRAPPREASLLPSKPLSEITLDDI